MSFCMCMIYSPFKHLLTVSITFIWLGSMLLIFWSELCIFFYAVSYNISHVFTFHLPSCFLTYLCCLHSVPSPTRYIILNCLCLCVLQLSKYKYCRLLHQSSAAKAALKQWQFRPFPMKIWSSDQSEWWREDDVPCWTSSWSTCRSFWCTDSQVVKKSTMQTQCFTNY